jgi:predicted RNA-binding protein YlqC (UPF0109 family)
MELINKPPTADEVADLFRELASLYVGTPDHLQVRVQESVDGSAYFMMRGAPEDDSRLVGNRGCHVNALAFLIEAVGRAQDRIFTFRLLTTPGSCAPWYPPKDALDYDPRPARELLCRLLSALGVPDFSVTVTPGTGPRRSLFFNFDVKIADVARAEALTVGETAAGSLSIVGALGTLFRAIAKQNGIRFQIRLADRPEPKEAARA